MGASQVPLVWKSVHEYGQGTVSRQSHRTDSLQWIHGLTAVNPFCVISEKQCPGHIYGLISKPRVPVKFPRPTKNFKSVKLPIFKKRNWTWTWQGHCFSQVQVIQSIHGFTAVNPFCVISEKQCPGHIYGPISKPRVPVKFSWPTENFKSVMLPVFKKKNWT